MDNELHLRESRRGRGVWRTLPIGPHAWNRGTNWSLAAPYTNALSLSLRAAATAVVTNLCSTSFTLPSNFRRPNDPNNPTALRLRFQSRSVSTNGVATQDALRLETNIIFKPAPSDSAQTEFASGWIQCNANATSAVDPSVLGKVFSEIDPLAPLSAANLARVTPGALVTVLIRPSATVAANVALDVEGCEALWLEHLTNSLGLTTL
jgi:hypothetical protein